MEKLLIKFEIIENYLKKFRCIIYFLLDKKKLKKILNWK